MKLLLTSQGFTAETKKIFLELLGKKPEEARLIFIPTAANPELDRWYLNKDKLRLAEIGINNISEVDLEKETPETLAPKLANADVVYVEGGNTFYLMKYVRASGFDVLVKQFLERGGLYFGISAGSIIVGPTIEPAAWKHADKNIVDLKDLSGMGLVPFAVTPHYSAEVATTVKEAVAKAGYPVVALSDIQAVLVNGERPQIIGPGEKVTFNDPGIS